MMPLLKRIKKTCKGLIEALPMTYRTTLKEPCFHGLSVPGTGKRAFPVDLCACVCSSQQIEEFARQARELGIQNVGLCCGNSGSMPRIVAEEYGRTPAAYRYRPCMENHYMFGDKTKLNTYHTEHPRNIKTGD